jgi:3-hydroxybutyryl-CoA dehydrogenase
MKVGIIGAGAMGAGIAQVAATAGATVKIYDANPEAIERARRNIAANLWREVEKGRRTEAQVKDMVARLEAAERLAALGASDLIIEAIVEDLEVKKLVFKELELDVSSQCILASNTSSLSIASIASACQHSERVVGIHFFNPAHLMQLVEIIPAIQTDEATTAAARTIIESWGKTVVIAKDTPGFIVNRVARPFYGEALRIYDEGIADMHTIDDVMRTRGGFRMGPFELMDFIGHDVNYAVTESVFRSFFFDPRYKPSFTQKRLVEAGFLGKKSGRGFYDYAQKTTTDAPKYTDALSEQIFNRIIAMLINEAADALFWGIASREDIELAMTRGVNYPRGLLTWGETIGFQTIVQTMDALYDTYREDRYRCSPWLRRQIG